MEEDADGEDFREINIGDDSDDESFFQVQSPLLFVNDSNVQGKLFTKKGTDTLHKDDDNMMSEESSTSDDDEVGNDNAADQSSWKTGDNVPVVHQFTGPTPGIDYAYNNYTLNDCDELFFLKCFITDEMISVIADETNRYAAQFFAVKTLKANSRFKKFKDVTDADVRAFLALVFYMGIVRKSNLKDYWTSDPVLCTSFPGSIMSRDKFMNILAMLHLSNNENYVKRGEQDYDPTKKLGDFLPDLITNFSSEWNLHREISIDEGTIPFKGRAHFKVYNPMKPDKYGIKLFELCDSVTGYCQTFEIYKGQSNQKPSEYGKIYDLVMRLMSPYLNRGHILHVDNYYTSCDLFKSLYTSQTHACGTLRINRKGLSKEFQNKKLKEKGDTFVMHTGNMVAMKLLDRKPVNFLSTIYNSSMVDTGKTNKHKEKVYKSEIVINYNKFMGGVDRNDQLSKYSAFNRQQVKWWKKVFFQLVNMAMVNAYIMYKFHCSKENNRIMSHADFRTNCIKQLIEETANELTLPKNRGQRIGSVMLRLMDRHYPMKIQPFGSKKNISRACVVCSHADRRKRKHDSVQPRKRFGRESSYQCKTCEVALCVVPCFELYHSYKDYIAAFLRMDDDDIE